MKPNRLILLALLAVVAAAQAKDVVPTVADVTQSNGKDKSGRLIVKTPSILSLTNSGEIPPDVQIAIREYDQLIELAADPDTRAEAMRRAAYLRVWLVDSGASADPAELRKAIALYERLLSEVPKDPGNDRALYQLARAYQLVGDEDSAIAKLRQLGQQYPASPLASDGVFRGAELLFVRGRYAEAESAYRSVVGFGAGTPFFEPAQYKLGWSLYKQSNYEGAIPVFFAILDRELPAATPTDPAAVKDSLRLYGSDALRVVGLSFAALGGGPAVNAHFARAGSEPRFATLVYNSLGALLLEQQRYTDAAATYTAFIERHPSDALAPAFQTRAIAAYRAGGFAEPELKAKETYVERYAPGSAYWGAKPASAEVLAELRKHLDELGHHYQARAQATPASDTRARQTDFIKAAGWYRRALELFPKDPKAAELNLLYADALYDGGRTLDAAQQYTQTAYAYGAHAKAPEAAYAAVQAYQRLASETPGAKSEAIQQSVASSIRLADTFPDHPQAAAALTRGAEDLYSIKDYAPAITLADRVLKSTGTVAIDARRSASGVVADSRFAQAKYPEAEAAYTALLKLDPPAASRRIAVEQLAASVYKQGEQAREAGDLRGAAAAFQRVGLVAPEATIRANADYDAGSALFALQDWPATTALLEAFRTRYPSNALLGDADKKLALAYEKDSKPALAAGAYSRIAQRTSETIDTRRDAAWLSAQLNDQAGALAPAARFYELYVGNYPQPLDRAMQARQRLADIALGSRDTASYQRWLREIVSVDSVAGSARNNASKQMAAKASLELGRIDAATARGLALRLPLEQSLAKRKIATETAIATLLRAASYGYAEVTTAASYELGAVYRDFSRALIGSQRPPGLNGDELEQYVLLLEEQADPFEQKAIEAHLANLQRLKQGVWDEWTARSVTALADLAPAKYGKREQRELSYETLR